MAVTATSKALLLLQCIRIPPSPLGRTNDVILYATPAGRFRVGVVRAAGHCDTVQAAMAILAAGGHWGRKIFFMAKAFESTVLPLCLPDFRPLVTRLRQAMVPTIGDVQQSFRLSDIRLALAAELEE